MTYVGDKIKEYRMKRGITQTKLAEQSGIHPVSIRKYEAGMMEPRLQQIQRIAEALEINAFLLQEKAGLTKKDADAALNAFITTIEEALVAGDRVQLIGFGTFETKARKEREGRNPRNPEEVVKIAASKAPVFKAGKALKGAVNK